MERRNFLKCLGLPALIGLPIIKQTEVKTEKSKPKLKKQKEEIRPALKPERDIRYYEISYFCDTTASRGTFVETKDLIAKPGHNGWLPTGVLLCDVVYVDFTKQFINLYGDEVNKGGKVTICSNGTLLVKCIGDPIINAPVYYDKEGVLTTEPESVRIGTFLSHKDEDGFARVRIEL